MDVYINWCIYMFNFVQHMDILKKYLKSYHFLVQVFH